MKTLELNQMELIEGGGAAALIGCLLLGAATGQFWVGFICAAMFNSQELH